MAKPRVFVSSTYYDLKHIRSSLELFIEGMGFEPVLSEKGDIAYSPDIPLDESCYREASTVDIFVLIIGGRFGSEASGSDRKDSRSFLDNYESITKKEFDSAIRADIPVYILIEKGVYSEFQTYRRNKDHEQVNYTHVDSVNVFRLVEDILSRPRNNPVHPFERSVEIEMWLKEQWAGLFRELLADHAQQKQLLELTGQVAELKAVNETLKTYLEAVMRGIDPDDSSSLIESEEKRLEERKLMEQISRTNWFRLISNNVSISPKDFAQLMSQSNGFKEFTGGLSRLNMELDTQKFIVDSLAFTQAARDDFNKAREILGLQPIVDWPFEPYKKHPIASSYKAVMPNKKV